MTLHDMCELIEDIGKDKAWMVLESEIVAKVRARQRLLFFQALHSMKMPFDMPNDNWRE